MTAPLLPDTLTVTATITGTVEHSYTFQAQVSALPPVAIAGVVNAANVQAMLAAAATALATAMLTGGVNGQQTLQQQVNNRAFNG